MLYKENGEWKLCTKKIVYEENGVEVENFVGSEGEDWWTEYSKKWGITIKSFIDLEYSDEQLKRLSDIKDIPEGFSDICSEYVIKGDFPQTTDHPLRYLQLRKTIEKLNKENMELMIASAEIYEQMYNENMTLMVALADMYEELQELKGVN